MDAGITGRNATAIVLGPNEQLRDFVTITTESDVDRVESIAPDSGEDIYV